MDTKQVQATTLKKGSYVILDNIPCKITNVDKSSTGKHGHTKCRIDAVSLFDDKKIVKVLPGHENVLIPLIDKRTAQILSVSGDTANVMDADNYETFDIKIPNEYKEQVKEGGEVLYWIVMGEKVIKQVK
jgi:translation initiation factor 5A